MDEDSDVDRDLLDNSLVDLHHGLDSSTEDNRLEGSNGGNQDVYVGNGTQPVNLPAQHVSMLEDMVQEMRQGLQAAVQELAKLQIREDGERDRQVQQQQQRQLDDLTENVNELKNQMNSVTKCLETIQRENSKMREDYASLTKYIKEGKGDGMAMSQEFDHSFEWNDKLSENPFEEENEEQVTCRDPLNKENDDEVTAVACKSLSLTQALGEKCLHLNLSMSSDEGDDPEIRRLSHINPSTSNVHQDNDANRRHSLPASTTPRGSVVDHVTNAGKRRKAVKELTDSECDYCSQLWTLVETYCSSLQNAGFLSHDQLEVLFPSYLEKLYEQHCVIYSNLQDKLVHWSYLTVVSDLLSCITDTHNPYSLMTLYREYSENLPDAVSCLRGALAHSTELKALLKTIQQSSYQNEDLMTLIKAPAQHLPKYLLQLQQICKYTPSTHPDYLLLRTSLSRLRLFVEQMNIGINNAIQTRSRDFQPGSSNDSSQILSARDSGNLSNEDELLSARTLFKSEQCLLSDEMHDDPYHLNPNNHQAIRTTHGRHSGLPRPKSANLNTLSHPDLSRINNSSAPPTSVPFSLPPSGLSHSWRSGVEGRPPTKNKMKRLPMQPAPYPHQDPAHLQSSSRPSSAIDFTNGYNVYPVHNYPGTNYPRPRSALGPLDSHHRPAIISRKHMRRSQPPLSNSGYWADNDSQHSKHSQQRMSFSPHELLPSRPSPLLPYNSQEDEEEDDTRASDSISCRTSSSHHQSSGRGSHNGHDIELEFQPLASDPSPIRSGGGRHMSEDDVAARLAQELLSDDDEDRTELDNVEVYDGINDKKMLQAAENKSYTHQRLSESKNRKNESERNVFISRQLPSRSNFDGLRDQSDSKLSNSNESAGFDSLVNEDRDNTKDKDLNGSSPNQDPPGGPKSNESRGSIQNGSLRDRALENRQPSFEEEDKRLKNQNFLLSLTHSPRSKKGPEPNSHTRSSRRNSPRSPQSRSPAPSNADKQSDKSYQDARVSVSQNSQPKVYRRSVPSLPSHTSNGPPQHRDHEARTVSPSQPSNGSFTTDPDNSITSAASSRHYMNTPSISAMPREVSSERTSSRSRHPDDTDSKTLMTRSLDLSEVLNSEDSKEGNDRRKKLKNGGTDSLPRASDDPVNARKKMHLKSSIKNLFSKKRGKVILADVEREVILEMASAVVSASTSPSVRSIQCSSDAENQRIQSPTFDGSKQLASAMSSKEVKQQGNENGAVAFEIKCKRDKGSSTSSPFKVWRPKSYIQPSDKTPKSFHRLSLNPSTLAQSPCTYQDKLLKERLNIQGNHDLDKKPLIHPKFLMPPSSIGNECLPTPNTTSHALHSITTSNITNVTSSTTMTHPGLSKEKPTQEDKCEKLKNDNLYKNISKYEEFEKKQIKAKMKAYAHMKKHILNYESQEAEVRDREERSKNDPDKNNAKPTKLKVECPKCQNRSSDGWKYLEQTPGKSFHIQAYKAYKSKNKENVTAYKQETGVPFNDQHKVYHKNNGKTDTVSSQSSMRLLKPCKEAIAFYETSRNPQMTSSYPMAAQDRKLKKNYPMKDSGHIVLHSNYNPVDGKKCKSKEKQLRENMLSFSSGIFYDGDCQRAHSSSVFTGNTASTNDLSHPTSTPISYNAVNIPKANYFNVPTPVPAASLPSNDLNKRHSIESTSCAKNILKMSKEEMFEYEKSRTLPKDLRGKPTERKMITKIYNNKDCIAAGISKAIVTNDMKQGQSIKNNADIDKKDVGLFYPKEEKDYFDYTYRLCYVDCSKYEGDLTSCANCSAEESSAEIKSFPDSLRNGEIVQNVADTSVTSRHENTHDTCSASVDKRLEIETKSCNEIDKWLANLNNSSPPSNKDSTVSNQQPKDKCLSINQPLPVVDMCSKEKHNSCSSGSRQRVSSCSPLMPGDIRCTSIPFPASLSNQGQCVLHPDGPNPSDIIHKYNCRNSTFETFSPSISQPIFSVLPIEGYRVDSQLSAKYPSHDGQTASQIDFHSSRAQDDAIARRALKQRVKSKDTSRLSTCSVQSANEIHIFKPPNSGDVQCPTEPETKGKPQKEGSPQQRNVNPGTLQVRYIPKQMGTSSKQTKVQTTAHAQIKRDSPCLNGTATNGVMRGSPPVSQQSASGAGSIGQLGHDHNGIAASGVSGPDLLQVSVIQPSGGPSKSDVPDQPASAPPKKLSFFSRFTHSPLSIFYKEAKSNGSK